MELKEFDIMLDIKKSKKIEDIEVVQKDYESNIFNISIVEDFKSYNLSGLNVEIAFAKPDGTTVLQDENNGVVIVNAIEGKIICTLKTNTIAAPGKVLAEVRILQDLKLLTTARFDFFVRKAIVNDETIESTNEFPILNQLINTTQDLIEQVGQIEQQVPENVVTQLNEVSDLANQLQVDLAAHNTENVQQVGGVHGLEIEQGLWTPKLIGAEVEGEHDYATQVGTYYKIGKFVICMFQIVLTSKDSNMSGVVRISGLPFTIDNQDYGASFSRGSGIIFNANDTQITGYGAGVFVQLNVLPSGGFVYANAVQNNASIRGSVSYVTM